MILELDASIRVSGPRFDVSQIAGENSRQNTASLRTNHADGGKQVGRIHELHVFAEDELIELRQNGLFP